jgi:hypothetical protein
MTVEQTTTLIKHHQKLARGCSSFQTSAVVKKLLAEIGEVRNNAELVNARI